MTSDSDRDPARPSTPGRSVAAPRTFVGGALHDLFHPPRGQVPALDALRACAIALVMVGHGTTAYLVSTSGSNAFSRLRVVAGAWIGVDLFFVLSGYFIGKQLWRELQETGTISFGRFIVRRGLRIWPLYFFFLAFVTLVLGRGGGPSFRGWSDVVFLTNYFHNQGVVMGSWTLCTEEQFYIIAPLLLIFGAARMTSLRGFRKYLVGILALLPAVRAFSWWRLTGSLTHHDSPLYTETLYQQFHTHCDGMVMGLLLANLEAVDGAEYKKGVFATPWCILATVPLFFLLQRISHETFNYTSVALTFSALVWFLLSGRPRRLAFLDWRGFYAISRLSYGMYFNNQYIYFYIAKFVAGRPFAARYPGLGNAATVALLFALSAGIAAVTFCLVEYPFLRLRERVLARWARPVEVGATAPLQGPVPSVADPVDLGEGRLALASIRLEIGAEGR